MNIPGFSEESLKAASSMIHGTFDFTVCQRADGSRYGTGGQCRKGTETTAEKPGLLSRAKGFAKRAVRKITGAEKKEKASAEQKVKEEKVAQKKAEAARRRGNTDDMINRISKDAPPGTEIKNVGATLMLSRTTRAGHKVDYIISRTGNVEFSVNGTWDAGTVKDRREQVEVALNVKRMHDAVVKNLKPGHKIWTMAWSEDGKGDARMKAYESMGFSKAQGEDNTMAARRTENGKLEPVEGKISSDTYLMRDQDFSEGEVGDIKLWFTAIFGYDAKAGEGGEGSQK
jgi:hypothetical protein